MQYFQKHQGLDVLGGEIYVHLNRFGQVTYVKTKVARDLPGSVTPAVSERDARDRALKLADDQSGLAGSLEVLGSRLLVLPLGIIKNEAGGKLHLAWEVEVADAETRGEKFAEACYPDASSGELLEQLTRIIRFDPVTRQVYDCAGGANASSCQLNVQSPTYPGYYHGRTEGLPPRGPFPNPNFPLFYGSTDVDDLYDRLSSLHNYFSSTFGLNGANGFGGLADWPSVAQQITRGVAHNDYTGFNPPCPGGGYFSRNTGTMTFCKGMLVPDVLGHEYSHGIVHHGFHDQNGFPIGLIYSGQTGSLDEGYADFMGEVFESNLAGSTDWTNGTGSGFTRRSLSNPHETLRWDFDNIPYPDRFHDWSVYCGGSDAGGAHENLTVPAHAFYLIAQGGEHNGCDIQSQGIDVAQRIFFRGWRTYFSRTVTFNEAYTDLIQASTDLYGPVVTAEVTRALQSVELNQPGLCSGLPESPPPCAIHHGGTPATAYTNATPTTTFEVAQEIWLTHTAATPNRPVDYQLLPHAAARPTWQETTPLALATATATTAPTGTLFTLFRTAMTEGAYDLMVDGNRDGHYQPWADTILPITIVPATTGVPNGTPPTITALKAIQPNPTREGAHIAFSLAAPADATLQIFDVAGRHIRNISTDSTLPAGTHVRAWDGRDDSGRPTGAGLYFVKLIAGGTVDTKKLVRAP